MIDVLSKPADQIGPDDIQALIDSKVPEGEQIEYKREPSAKGAKRSSDPDDWMTEKAKNSLLEEAVAFANAYGGALLLGIGESESKPPIAAEISPIPRCAELADRLKNVFRDCVDPQIPRIEIFGVPTKGDCGVVVIRVGGQSRLAPHRVTQSRVCPIRRQDRCDEMTMREIQDMTLNVSRGLERVDKRFSERAGRFQEEFKSLKEPEAAVGFRATAFPVGDEIWFDRVYRSPNLVEGLDAPWRTVSLCQSDRQPYHQLGAFVNGRDFSWRPILRAARGSLNNRVYDLNVFKEIHFDGLIELGFVRDSGSQGPSTFYWGWPASIFANLLIQAHQVRSQADVPMAEYAIEVEVRVMGGGAIVHLESMRQVVRFGFGSHVFPRYSLREPDEVHDLLKLFYRDFYNALGQDVETEECRFEIDGWPSQETDAGAEDPS